METRQEYLEGTEMGHITLYSLSKICFKNELNIFWSLYHQRLESNQPGLICIWAKHRSFLITIFQQQLWEKRPMRLGERK